MNDRILQIQDIVSIYTNRFTSACMADSLATEEREQKAANTWLKAQIAANGITKEELKIAFQTCQQQAQEEGNPFCYDMEMIK